MATGSPTLEQLADSVRKGSPGGSELDHLGRAVALSEELSTLADDLVGHFVEAARRGGCSWAQIGHALGVTRQAAQQRYVATAQAGTRTFGRFGPEARQTLALAEDEARGFGHDYVGTEHLLLGLLGQATGPAVGALGDLGVTPRAVRACLEAMVGRGSCPPSGALAFTPRTKRVLELAAGEADRMGDDEIATEHLLLAIVSEGEGLAAKVLADHGVGDQPVRRQLGARLGRPCPPRQNRRRRKRSFGR